MVPPSESPYFAYRVARLFGTKNLDPLETTWVVVIYFTAFRKLGREQMHVVRQWGQAYERGSHYSSDG